MSLAQPGSLFYAAWGPCGQSRLGQPASAIVAVFTVPCTSSHLPGHQKVLQGMRNVSIQIQPSCQPERGRMDGCPCQYPRNSLASSQWVLFALRFPSHRETWESHWSMLEVVWGQVVLVFVGFSEEDITAGLGKSVQATPIPKMKG